MAGTTASEINDLFLSRVNDYNLDLIFTTSGSAAFTVYLEPWLLNAISQFSPICNQDLTYTSSTLSTEGSFTETLTQENKLILSKLMTLYWLEKLVNNVLQMQNYLQDHDYRTHANSAGITARNTMYTALKEEVSQLLINYEYKNNSWENWENQIFN